MPVETPCQIRVRLKFVASALNHREIVKLSAVFASLLVVETSQVDLHASDEAVDDLIKQIRSMTHGTRYYVPRT